MNHADAIALLLAAGFDSGWALAEGVLILWEHETDPPAPLVRPTEANNEATTADANAGTDPE
jgi:hypothetical protein